MYMYMYMYIHQYSNLVLNPKQQPRSWMSLADLARSGMALPQEAAWLQRTLALEYSFGDRV